MSASFVTNPDEVVPLHKWWMGEKYDGLRCCWVPIKRKLYSRFGNEYILLSGMYRFISPISADAELWFGRENFSLTHQFVNKSFGLVMWNLLRLIIFDAPSGFLQNRPFEYRYKLLLASLARDSPFTHIASRFLIQKSNSTSLFVNMIIENGGEGAILRKVGSLYDHGRSPSLIKLKIASDDKEGIVVGIHDKSIQLQLPNGYTLTVPPEDVHVNNLSIGEIVTFSYETHGQKHVPVNVVIYRRRNDVTWKDVVQLFVKDQMAANDSAVVPDDPDLSDDQMRDFLESLAKKFELDPLHPATWYKINESDLCQFSEGKTIVKAFKGYANAITHLFSDVQFEPSSFNTAWNSVENRRLFFENYARENGFEPLVPENWYSQSGKAIMQSKDAQKVIYFHEGSISRALLDLFPEIGFDKSKFWNLPLWNKPSRRRKFFENFAKENNFDPLNAHVWYQQSARRMKVVKGASRVLEYHGHSISKALMDLFPEVEWDKSKFWTSPWSSSGQRRNFFEKFAKSHGFDPLAPANWYSDTTRKQLGELKDLHKVLRHHSHSLPKALADLFPQIRFEESKFKKIGHALWENAENRRKLLEEYAKVNGFDPLKAENWLLHSRKSLLSFKGVPRVITYHGGSVTRALCDLFPEVEFDRENSINSLWNKPIKRRNFFENFAKENSFDPIDPEQWYQVSRKHVMLYKGAHRVLQYHNDSLSKALVDLFPDIGLDRSKFWSKSKKSGKTRV
eukprot:Phypoly_transcript_02156.p1 GENE.Phypoly_transcript_02156~~Phypoly_transcript_02156.p1  ORF type:complete len:735 (+),score=101.72 Phypoly_transcript_02156:694-2898(+)